MAIGKMIAKNPQKLVPLILVYTHTVLCAKQCNCHIVGTTEFQPLLVYPETCVTLGKLLYNFPINKSLKNKKIQTKSLVNTCKYLDQINRTTHPIISLTRLTFIKHLWKVKVSQFSLLPSPNPTELTKSH